MRIPQYFWILNERCQAWNRWHTVLTQYMSETRYPCRNKADNFSFKMNWTYVLVVLFKRFWGMRVLERLKFSQWEFPTWFLHKWRKSAHFKNRYSHCAHCENNPHKKSVTLFIGRLSVHGPFFLLVLLSSRLSIDDLLE